jgi:hypothetical protein
MIREQFNENLFDAPSLLLVIVGQERDFVGSFDGKQLIKAYTTFTNRESL